MTRWQPPNKVELSKRDEMAARVRQLGIKAPSFDAFSIAPLRNTRLPKSSCILHVRSSVRYTCEPAAADNNGSSQRLLEGRAHHWAQRNCAMGPEGRR